MKLEQLVYGKLVQSADGPIVPRLDYRVTGASPGYPEDLVAQSHPYRTGLNTSDLFNWERYPWNAVGGGFIVRATSSGQEPTVIIGRIRGRSEKGEGQPGRIYVQSHYAVIHAEQWDAAAIALLPDVLAADPMTAEDRAMPQLQLDDRRINDWLARPLEAGWVDRIAEPIAAVMSGCAFSIQDWQASIDEFLDHCATCVCALPRTLAWRLSIGAGLGDMKGDVALGLGQIAPPTGVRVIGGTIHGADESELAAGKRYVGWLRRQASTSRTAGELRGAVARALPQFAEPFALDARLDWRAAASSIASTVVEHVKLAELGEWLMGEAGPTPNLGFIQLRDEALGLVLRNLDPRGLELLPACIGTDWWEVWTRLADGDAPISRLAKSVSRLAGVIPDAPKVEDIEYFTRPLPGELARRFRNTLDRELRARRLDARWESVIEDRTDRAPWLDQWLTNSGDIWFWIAIDNVQRGDDRLLQALRDRRSDLVGDFDLLRSRQAGVDYKPAAEALVSSAQRSGAKGLEWLLNDLIQAKKIRAAISVAEACDQRRLNIRAAHIFLDTDPVEQRRRADLAQALADELDGFPSASLGSIALNLILASWPRPRMSGRLRDAMSGKLGYPFAKLLLGIDSPPESIPPSPIAERLARSAFRNDVSIVDRLWEELCKNQAGPFDLETLFLSWIDDSRVAEASQLPTVRFLAHLYKDRSYPLPDREWTGSEARRVKRLIPARLDLVERALSDAETVGQLRNGFRICPLRASLELRSPKLFAALVDRRANDDPEIEPLLEQLYDRRLQSEPVWRLLFLPWRGLRHFGALTADAIPERVKTDTADPRRYPFGLTGTVKPTAAEVELAKNLAYPRRLHLAALGVRLPPELLICEISPERLAEENLSLNALAELARAARAALPGGLLATVNDVLLRHVLRSPEAREQLAAELARGSLERIGNHFIRKKLLPIVETIQTTLAFLPQEERERLENEFLRKLDKKRGFSGNYA